MSSSDEKPPKPALGRGLAALIPQAGGVPISGDLPDRQIVRLPIESIHPDTNQPRKVFNEAKLRELADSIRTQGLIQPVLVRRDETGYRIIAGERRWRAAPLAGLTEIPCIIREATNAQAFEIALVENLQRADLNPIEEADGYRRLMADYSFTQEQTAQRVGKERSTVANSLRLLSLPDEVKDMLASEELTMGHAKALLGLSDPREIISLAKKVAAQSLNVRDTERLVQKIKGPQPAKKKKTKTPENLHAQQMVEELQRNLGTRVRLKDKGGKGSLEIDFFSYEDLDRLVARLNK